METTMVIDTEFKTEFIKMMDIVFEDFDFDIEFEFKILDFFKFRKKK